MSLTYGIDIHGTLANRDVDGIQKPSTLFPLLKPLMEAWINHGERVIIVSGPPEEGIRKELEALGLFEYIHFDVVLSVVDYLKAKGVPMTEDPPGSNHWWCDGDMWSDAKGAMASEYGIDIVVDDQLEYADAMPVDTDFVHVTAEVLHPNEDIVAEEAAKLIGKD